MKELCLCLSAQKNQLFLFYLIIYENFFISSHFCSTKEITGTSDENISQGYRSLNPLKFESIYNFKPYSCWSFISL